uniref:Uncharacterized protein n=1 Tax=uncultured marine thaumarchaeote KM3_163_G06 TaxID=1456034 RepID=A0A075GMX3_9ARCH|nr:hypothetical protein [uncultured marine thaumarchaeote KM3_163_G06]
MQDMREKDKQASKNGKKAHRETIGPSHDKCEDVLRHKFPTYHVTSTKGLPDFVLFKIAKFIELMLIELKPCRLGKNQRPSSERMYLSLTQEITILFLLKCGAYVGIVYYIKAGKKFRYSNVVKLTLKNYKSYCFSTPWEKRTDPDTLF